MTCMRSAVVGLVTTAATLPRVFHQCELTIASWRMRQGEHALQQAGKYALGAGIRAYVRYTCGLAAGTNHVSQPAGGRLKWAGAALSAGALGLELRPAEAFLVHGGAGSGEESDWCCMGLNQGCTPAGLAGAWPRCRSLAVAASSQRCAAQAVNGFVLRGF